MVAVEQLEKFQNKCLRSFSHKKKMKNEKCACFSDFTIPIRRSSTLLLRVKCYVDFEYFEGNFEWRNEIMKYCKLIRCINKNN